MNFIGGIKLIMYYQHSVKPRGNWKLKKSSREHVKNYI